MTVRTLPQMRRASQFRGLGDWSEPACPPGTPGCVPHWYCYVPFMATPDCWQSFVQGVSAGSSAIGEGAGEVVGGVVSGAVTGAGGGLATGIGSGIGAGTGTTGGGMSGTIITVALIIGGAMLVSKLLR